MLHAIKRWFSGAAGAGWVAAEEWALSRGHTFRRSRDADGFIIEFSAPGAVDPLGRLEWGPSQRPYIDGAELRLRGEIGEVDLQMMVLSRTLMDSMEKAVFEQFTEDLQTRIDTSTPEEMRWLVLFAKLPANDLKTLRDSYGAAGSSPKWLQQWIDGPLSAQLQQARATWLAPEDPLALILQRGRLTFRTAMQQPDAARLSASVELFTVALREARRVAIACGENAIVSTQPSLWTGPADPGPSRR